ncbi:MAG: ribonuclease HI family protein [Proteobacteria bacterium]|nr:ribonuclease HI family protein [Pseudomonadota bacterium]
MKAKLYCDGASRGNPGEAGIGCVIFLNDNRKIEISEYIGQTTNNVAEYNALIRGLEETLKIGVEEIEIFSDSELLVRQITGIYKVKNKNLIPLYEKIKQLLSNLKSHKIIHINREDNSMADKLAKEASWKIKR